MVSESHSVSRKESAGRVGDNRSITQSRSLVEPVSVAVLLEGLQTAVSQTCLCKEAGSADSGATPLTCINCVLLTGCVRVSLSPYPLPQCHRIPGRAR